MEYRLNVPFHQADLEVLRAGDVVYCSGVIYTARDAAHARLMDLLRRGEPLPPNTKSIAAAARRRNRFAGG